MYDRLLYKKVMNVPISIIQEKVSKATEISLENILIPDKQPGARKKEFVGARQISMSLSMTFTKLSLESVGNHHGGRDHATVLHAVKTVNNMLDTKDHITCENYKKAIDLIRIWNDKRPDAYKVPTFAELTKRRKILLYDLKIINEHLDRINPKIIRNKSIFVKAWINNHVPLEIRQTILNSLKSNQP